MPLASHQHKSRPLGSQVSFELMATAYRRKRLLESLLEGDQEVQAQIELLAEKKLQKQAEEAAAGGCGVGSNTFGPKAHNFRLFHFEQPDESELSITNKLDDGGSRCERLAGIWRRCRAPMDRRGTLRSPSYGPGSIQGDGATITAAAFMPQASMQVFRPPWHALLTGCALFQHLQTATAQSTLCVSIQDTCRLQHTQLVYVSPCSCEP